jgi:hypothetical protein
MAVTIKCNGCLEIQRLEKRIERLELANELQAGRLAALTMTTGGLVAELSPKKNEDAKSESGSPGS